MIWRCDSAAVSVWMDKIMCCWWRPEFAVQQFIEGYKAVLVKDTSYKGLWKVSFTLKEF